MTEEEKKLKAVVNLDLPAETPDISPTPLREGIQLFTLLGMIEIVTTAPTLTPNNFYGQFKLYTDSLSAPSVYKLYVFMPQIKVWKSVALT